MAGVTIRDATLSATFHTLANVVSPTEAKITISTINYSDCAASTQYRDHVTEIQSCYHESSATVSVFIKRGDHREVGRFVTLTPSFPPSRTPLCSRFQQGNSLVRLLSNTAAEVAYFNGNGLNQRLTVTGKYFRAAVRGFAQDSNTLVKLVVADSRLAILGSKPGEFVYRTMDNIRYTRMEKYEGTDIATGTLVVFVSMNDPFLFQPTSVLFSQFVVPEALATNLWRLYSRPSIPEPKYPKHIMPLVRYVDLCTVPIIDGLPDQGEYLDILNKQSTTAVIEHLIVAADIYDQCLLNNVFGILTNRINGRLNESLEVIAASLGFFRVGRYT